MAKNAFPFFYPTAFSGPGNITLEIPWYDGPAGSSELQKDKKNCTDPTLSPKNKHTKTGAKTYKKSKYFKNVQKKCKNVPNAAVKPKK